MSAGILIRTAVLEDAEGIARTYLESAEHHFGLDPERYSIPTVETVTALYRKSEQAPSEVTLVAVLDGQIVGFVDARLEQSPDAMHRDLIYCHIAEIAVSGTHRSRGIGGQLLGAAEEWGRKLGAEFASLEYNAANTRAGLFYQERMGYRVGHMTAIKRL